jgi:alpha-beta hydrolase superfamily lysophospholipase
MKPPRKSFCLSRRWLLAACVPLLLLGLHQVAKAQDFPFLNPPADNPFKSLLEAKPALNLELPLKSAVFEQYLDFYGLNYPGVDHYAGYVAGAGEQNFVHVLRPNGPSKGLVVTMHGYFVHTGLIVHLISSLLDAGYTVASIDLPGHGLSSGARASIQEFSSYAEVLARVTHELKPLPGPRYLIGHSTGGAGAWEYVLKDREQPYEKVVLLAPLVHSAFWELSMLGFYLGQGWMTELPRVLRPTSSDPSFIAMVRKDPLQYAATPVQWVRALIAWNEQVVETYPPTQVPMLIFQGTDDTVVDWKYNLPFLQRKFPLAEIKILPGANHDLLWEAPEIRIEVFTGLLAFLAGQPEGNERQSGD